MKEESIVYKSPGTESKGFLVYETSAAKKPAVLVAHAWKGQDEFAKNKARELAALGYVAFAIDMYGLGTTADTNERAQALMLPLFMNRKLLRERVKSAYETVKSLDFVDPTNIGAIGFCFGGLVCIELLRSGVDLKGVVSFHTLVGNTFAGITAQPLPAEGKMKGALLILQGYSDPLISQQDFASVAKEMTEANVDWQIHWFGHTSHAFTNPEANDPHGVLKYNPVAAKRAWLEMQNFFDEQFS